MLDLSNSESSSSNRGSRIALVVVVGAWIVSGLSVVPAQADERPPNVVLMLSDNLGFGEIGAYGGGVLRGAPTPRLDRMAAEGVRFTNFNVEVECTPSRSALMTGRLPVRSGTWRVGTPGLPGGLPPWEKTVAEMLSAVGYDTAIYGKWHLGDADGRYPTDQGFDEWWGFPFSTWVATYRDHVGFDPDNVTIPYLLEGRKGEEVKKVEPYTVDNRPFIDERIAEKSTAYIRGHAEDEDPFFLFVSWSLVHHPYLAHPDFAGESGNGAFSDVMIEHDHRVGQILDAVEDAGIAENTLVLYVSDNGPDAARYPVVSSSGPYRGYLSSAFEGSIRTPMMAHWPGRISPGRVTNEIVSLVDLFPTIANLTGGAVPDDRVIDGLDQSGLLLGETDESARESVLFFSGRTLLAVKWRRFKIFMMGDDPRARDRSWERLVAPRIYNVEQDQREEVDIGTTTLWVLEPLMKTIYPFLFSVEQEGLILPGGDKPEPANVEIPFQSQEEIEKSMSAIRWMMIKKKAKGILPFGEE